MSPHGAPAVPPLRVDVRGVRCPLTWVRTRVALEAVPEGGVLEVVLLEGEPLENVPRTAEEEGHRVLERSPFPEQGPGAWRVLLARGSGRAPPPGDLMP